MRQKHGTRCKLAPEGLVDYLCIFAGKDAGVPLFATVPGNTDIPAGAALASGEACFFSANPFC